MNKFVKKTAGAAAFIALLGAGTAVGANTAIVAEASVKYSIKTVKKAYIYTSKGKKTKKFYKKNTSLKAYGTKWIKGKKYYILGKGRYIRTVNAKKPAKYSYSVQTKKISRMIKMYTPKGVKKVVQKAYIKRTVKTNLKTKKKTYGKWSTSRWTKYSTPKVSGYTASRASVGAAKVTSKTKNKTVKITYKLVKKTAPKKTNTKPVTKPSTTPSKPANNGKDSSSNMNTGASTPSQPTTKPSQPAHSGSSSSNTGSSSFSGSSSSNTADNGGMAAQYKLETKDATITPGSNYSSIAFKVKYANSDKNAGSDKVKSVSVDNKAPFNVSIVQEYGVYNLKASPAVGQSGTYNVPVTVTYTDGTKETVMIKITVQILNYWTDATKASARAKLLDVINGFRSAVGVSPVTLDTTPEYQNYLNQRATEKAKQYAETKQVDHSGATLFEKFHLTSASDECISPDMFDATNSLDNQVILFSRNEQKSIQAEKDDYEAINIRHERNYLTNPSGTVLHYLSFINSNFSKVVIGVGTYNKNGTNYTAAVMAFLK